MSMSNKKLNLSEWILLTESQSYDWLSVSVKGRRKELRWGISALTVETERRIYLEEEKWIWPAVDTMWKISFTFLLSNLLRTALLVFLFILYLNMSVGELPSGDKDSVYLTWDRNSGSIAPFILFWAVMVSNALIIPVPFWR